jgi:hypothetical protein
MFNSTIYATDVVTNCVGVLALESFLHGENYLNNFGNPTAASDCYVDEDLKGIVRYIAERAKDWEALDISEC